MTLAVQLTAPAEDAPRFFSALGPRFHAADPHDFAAELQRDAIRFPADVPFRELDRTLSDCHHVFVWRAADAEQETALRATATWRHTIGFRFLHLRAAMARRQPPGDWLAACLAELARFGRGEVPAIVVIEASAEFEPEMRRQVAALGGTAVVPQVRADMQTAIVRCVEQALAEPAASLPLCLLVTAETHWRNPA